MTLLDNLEKAVDKFIADKLAELAGKKDKLMPGTWQGYQGSQGLIKIADGVVKLGPTNHDAAGIRLGTPCWWDGKMILVPKAVKRRNDPRSDKRRQTTQAAVERKVAVRVDEENAPYTYAILTGEGVPHQTNYGIMSPSGDYPTIGLNYHAAWDISFEEFFLKKDFWLTSYPDPPQTGWFETPYIIQFGDDPTKYSDNTCWLPYVHVYEWANPRTFGLRCDFMDGPVSLRPDNVTIQYDNVITTPQWIETHYIYTVDDYAGEWAGAIKAYNKEVISTQRPLSTAVYNVGDVVTMRPYKQCDLDFTSNCEGPRYKPSAWLTAPTGDPWTHGGAVVMTIDRVYKDSDIDSPYYEHIRYEVTPTPGYPGGIGFDQKSYAATYGRLVRAGWANQAETPTKEALVEQWASGTTNRDGTTGYMGSPWMLQDWMVDDGENQPPDPPMPVGYSEMNSNTLGAPWYTASRNGVLWGYEIFTLWTWKDGYSWERLLNFNDTDATHSSMTHPSMTSYCRNYSEDQLSPWGMLFEGDYKSPLFIIRYKIDTVNMTFEHEVFEWVDTLGCVDGTPQNGNVECGFYDDYLFATIEDYFYPDDPRVTDGLVGYDCDVQTYDYDKITGRLYLGDEVNINYALNDPDNQQEYTEVEFVVKPEEIELGTMAFAQWVYDAMTYSLDVEEYSVHEYKFSNPKKLAQYVLAGTNTDNNRYSTAYGALRYSPKSGPPGSQDGIIA